MLAAAFDLARPLLFALEPEMAHELTLKSLEAGIYPRPSVPDDPRLALSVWGMEFPNPLGIAAGFDKDARVPDAVLGMGFGFAEIGSVTPLPQAGNPRPRVFRLIEDGALINRLGFNNGGHAQALARLQARRAAGVVGVNVGANKDATDRAADYAAGVRAVHRRGLVFHDQRVVAQHARACAICRRRPRSTICWRACSRRVPRWLRPASRRGRSWSSWHPTSPRRTWSRSCAF